MERIYKRISDDHPGITYGRDYWLHLHEHEGSLRELDREFRGTLHIGQRMAPFKVVEIETGKHSEEEVSNLISDYSVNFHKGYPFENWAKI